MKDMPRVLIGSEGWFDDPKGEFYPEDLPEDWRLSFYNTSFNTVLLDASHFIDEPSDEVASWPLDINPYFRFLVAVHAHYQPQAIEHLQQRLTALGEHLGGLVVRTSEYGLEELRGLREQLADDTPIFVYCEEPQQWQAIYEHGFFPCWRSQADIDSLDPTRQLFHGVLMLSAEAREPRQLRALLEAADQRINRQGVFYLIYSEPQPGVQIMHNGTTLCELLGIL